MRSLTLIAIVSVILHFTFGRAVEAEPVVPAALKPGDTIRIVAPAGDLKEDAIRLAAKRLKEMGFIVQLPDTLFRKRGYLAGTDQERASELMEAFTDPAVDAVFPGAGGYGTTRLLDLLDWNVIAANPKIVIGFSDITGLHAAIRAKCNWVTFHSPNPEWGLGSEDGMPAFAERYFWRCLLKSKNTGIAGFSYDQPDAYGPRVALAGGSAQGRLIGGNLSLVAALAGTDYEPDTNGAILFLEDINESPYRVDRMLSTLKLAGLLDKPAGVLLGQFHKCEPDDPSTSLSLQTVFEDYFSSAPYPVISNFPAGHVPLNATLPLGCLASIDAASGDVRLLESPVSSFEAAN